MAGFFNDQVQGFFSKNAIYPKDSNFSFSNEWI